MKFFNLVLFVIIISLYSSITMNAQDKELSVYRYTFGYRYYMDGDKISKKEFVQTLNSHAPSKKLYSHAKTNQYIGIGFNVLQTLTIFGTFQGAIDNDIDKSLNYLYANVALGAVSIYFRDLSISYTRRSIHEYNHKNSPKPKFTFGTSANNLIGIQYSLNSK